MPVANRDVETIPEIILLASMFVVVRLFQLSLMVLLVFTVPIILILALTTVIVPLPVAVKSPDPNTTPATLLNASARR